MKFKNYSVIFALFFLLMCSVSAISAVSNDTMDSIASEIDSDDTISLSDDENSIAINDEDSKVNAQNDDNESILKSSGADDDSLIGASSSKSNLKIVNYTNFVKKGSTYYFYLTDLKGKVIPNKKLTVKFDGKTYQKTTNANGRVGIKVKSSASSSSMDISFSGDKQYNAFSQKLKFYIDKSISLTIGNSKLLTNGFLRIYLSGPKNSISGKTVKIKIGNKEYSKKTTSEGFIVTKPKVGVGTYNVIVTYGKYVVSKTIRCIEGNTVTPLTKSIPMVNGVPDIDVMPSYYVMGDNNAKYTLEKAQYQEVLRRDSHCLFLYGKLSKYTFFKTKESPNVKHIVKREKWNVIERTINTKLVKNNRYSNYWPSSVTVSLKGKSYTYPIVRDIQNTGYTCGPTSASSCSQALKKYFSEKYFQVEGHATGGINIPDLKNVLNWNGFKASYFYSMDAGVRELKKGGTALIAFLPNHYVSILDVSRDGSKILVSNSYGAYDVGGDSRIPTGWVSLSYFKSKYQGIGLVVRLNYNLGANQKTQLYNYYTSMGTNWVAQNTNERIPNVPI